MRSGLPYPDVIEISDSSDESTNSGSEDVEVVQLQPRLIFSPRPYSEEPIVDNRDENGSRSFLRNEPSEDNPVQRRRKCLDRVLEVFPDISHEHIGQLYDDRPTAVEGGDDSSGALILEILDSGTYPKEKDRRIVLKRKRENERGDEHTDDEKAAAAWAAREERHPIGGEGYFYEARRILADDYPSTPFQFIDDTLRVTGKNLYAAYAAIALAERTLQGPNPPYRKLKKSRKSNDGVDRLSPTWLRDTISHYVKISDSGMLEELHAARKKRMRDELKQSEEADKAAAEALNEKEHRDMGMMVECQCCFDDLPFNRTTHCEGEEPHFFCLECAKRNASNEIGQSRHKLCCMDSSGCKAEFHREQILRFLDEKTLRALDRLKQQDDIRQAELEDLVNCPFCDFAAICPPVDIDREFRCHNQDCEKVSCRLCKQETHIPLSCEAHAKENKFSVRHAVEEAMTQALLRSCNKCKESYVKEFGCNKMTCPKCRSMQCYVCSKTISAAEGYNHFNQGALRGRHDEPGKCPLQDNTEQRQQEDIQKAEQAALAKIKADNPHLTEEELKVKFSDVVKLDDGRRLAVAGGPLVFAPQILEQQYPRDFVAGPMPPMNLARGGRVMPNDPNHYFPFQADQPAVPHHQPVLRLPQPPPFGQAIRNDLPGLYAPNLALDRLQARRNQREIALQAQRFAHQQAQQYAQQYVQQQALRAPVPQYQAPAPVQPAAWYAEAAGEARPFPLRLQNVEVKQPAQQQPIGHIDQDFDYGFGDEFDDGEFIANALAELPPEYRRLDDLYG